MASANMTIRVNPDIKRQAQALFARLGMDMTTAINVFLRQALEHGGLPFAVRCQKDVPNDATVAAMKAVQDHEGMTGPFDSLDDLMESLDA